MLLRDGEEESNRLREHTGEKKKGGGLSQRDVGDEERKGVWVESLVPGH